MLGTVSDFFLYIFAWAVASLFLGWLDVGFCSIVCHRRVPFHCAANQFGACHYDESTTAQVPLGAIHNMSRSKNYDSNNIVYVDVFFFKVDTIKSLE